MDKSADEDIRKNKKKVVVEEITESEREKKIKTKHESDDEDRGISKAVNKSVQKNHGYMTDNTDKSKNEVTNGNCDSDDILAQITAQINKLGCAGS